MFLQGKSRLGGPKSLNFPPAAGSSHTDVIDLSIQCVCAWKFMTDCTKNISSHAENDQNPSETSKNCVFARRRRKFWPLIFSLFKKPPLFVPDLQQGGGLSYKSAEGRKILGDFPPVLLRKTLLKRCFCNGKSVFGSPKSQNFPPAAGSNQHSHY